MIDPERSSSSESQSESHVAAPAPMALEPNVPERPYRGGAGIGLFRGLPAFRDDRPEDFVGSMTEIFSGHGVGLSTLPGGELLVDAVRRDPSAYFGPSHLERHGSTSELLVKLLDPGERLFVHFHPEADFARRELGTAHGKTEAWIVVDTRSIDGDHDPYAYLGFTREVAAEEVERWVEGQQVDDMLAAMHRVSVSAGDTIYVPAGLAHSIGPGITLVELQEPSDLSVLMEYEGFGLTSADAFLGLPRGTALSALDRRAWSTDEIEALIGRGEASERGPGVWPLLPDSASTFFRADLVSASTDHPARLDAEFAIAIAIRGSGLLAWPDGTLPIERGQTVLIPFGSGPLTVDGEVSLLRCRPPR